MTKEALTLALDGITKIPTLTHGVLVKLSDIESAIKEALSSPNGEAQPEQEPVAWPMEQQPDGSVIPIDPEEHPNFYTWTWDKFVSGGKWRAEYGWKKPEGFDFANLQPLYTHPPVPTAQPEKEPEDLTIAYMAGLNRGKELAQQRTWVGLTDEERSTIWGELPQTSNEERDACTFAECIEIYLKERNT